MSNSDPTKIHSNDPCISDLNEPDLKTGRGKVGQAVAGAADVMQSLDNLIRDHSHMTSANFSGF